MTKLISYPWKGLEKGAGFFVPALDLSEATEAGLRAAVRARVIDAKARPCIKDGLLGVWFYRASPAPPKRA